MTTLAELQAYAEKLREARYNGLRSVRDQTGEEVTFRSDSEIANAIRAVETEIRNSVGDRLTTAYINTSKGL